MSRVVGRLLFAEEREQLISSVIAHLRSFARDGQGIVVILGITQVKLMEVGLDKVVGADLVQVRRSPTGGFLHTSQNDCFGFIRQLVPRDSGIWM